MRVFVIYTVDEHGSIRSKWRFLFYVLKNKSFFVYTKCLRFFNKSFQKKKIAPANYTAEVVCIDQIIPKST